MHKWWAEAYEECEEKKKIRKIDPEWDGENALSSVSYSVPKVNHNQSLKILFPNSNFNVQWINLYLIIIVYR